MSRGGGWPLPFTEPHGGTSPVGTVRLPALDGLRGCAIGVVLLLHFTSELAAPSDPAARVIKQAFGAGWVGIDLFFVLSGFLITGLLADAREMPGRYRVFYARRALRILPLYYGFLLLLFAVPPLLGEGASAPGLREQLPYWLYLQNFAPLDAPAIEYSAHLWSLAIEEQFYLVWPLVVYSLTRRATLVVCITCVAAALAIRMAGVLILEDLRPLYFLTPTRIDGLALGGAVALAGRASGGWARLRRSATPVLAASGAVLSGALVHPAGFDPGGAYMVLVGYTALAFLFAALLVLALDREGWLARVLSTRLPRFFGRYSYGLYVLHVPLVALGRRAGLTPGALGAEVGELAGLLAYIALLTGCSILVALASWRFFESPFLRRKPPYLGAEPARG